MVELKLECIVTINNNILLCTPGSLDTLGASSPIFFFIARCFFNLYDIKRLKMALLSSEQDYYQCLGKLHWNKLVLITIILPVYIKSFPIVVKTLLGYVVW